MELDSNRGTKTEKVPQDYDLGEHLNDHVNYLKHELLSKERQLEEINRELFLTRDKLNKQQIQNEIIFENSPHAFIIFNREGIVLAVNQNAADTLFLTKENLLNKSFTELLSQDSKSSFNEHLYNVFNIKSNYSSILKVHSEAKEGFFLSIESKVVASHESGEKLCLSIIKRAEELNGNKFHKQPNFSGKAGKDNDDINLGVNKFFSIIAHDLKSPLSGLIGFTEILNNEFDQLTEIEKKEFIGHAFIAAKNLNALLENLLDWSRIQIGGILIKPEILKVSSVVDDIINLFTQNAYSKKIYFNQKIDPYIKVIADKNSLDTILRNLISNAIKFSHDNSTVTISADVEGDFVRISVEDNGTGISADDLQKLFRVDLNYTTIGTSKERGTGLGLLICKDLVEKNGGRIWAESSIGKGTKMIFTLPRKPETK